ncbi:glycerophosphodiester phosphodiesterase family protein [Microbacterium sp. YY-01]|uniref:glycerophosphodiester phosphodiesterase family protein n=1 Tax=Microbacterium sp. YY-01 TaxID=3421634 RepID=UPI003D18033A
MTKRPPLVIGHRGAPGYRPEHSRSSYELAFEMGVDAVEPDVVATADGVLVVRHENEISTTTDIAERPEFADRKTTRTIDGQKLTGWFTEDFTWNELSTLRCRERLPQLRPSSASFNDMQPMMRFTDLLDAVREASLVRGREIGVVLEVKHAHYFSSIGLDLAPLVERDLRERGWADGEWPLTIESFEGTVLGDVRQRGIRALYVYLLESKGKPADLVAAVGVHAPTYARQLTPAGLDELAGQFDGISVSKSLLVDRNGTELVTAAHARDLRVFTWTCRPENAFLAPKNRGPGGRAAFGDWQAEWRHIARTGVDGVFVDHPDLGVDLFRERLRVHSPRAIG